MAKANSDLLVIRWLKPTAINGKSISFPFIAVPFMGRIIEVFDGFSQNKNLPNTYGDNTDYKLESKTKSLPLYNGRLGI
ncbi:hypothetical protein [Mucilaginibacter lappiensis]|uniref:hypothetical protein n=1 Tax=Mucilaginibacter lappiensis TaxID=354630 RepID=UPI001589FFE0|nr:hypothetical protein [Mucilaginibacter lappiensis]